MAKTKVNMLYMNLALYPGPSFGDGERVWFLLCMHTQIFPNVSGSKYRFSGDPGEERISHNISGKLDALGIYLRIMLDLSNTEAVEFSQR